MFYIEKKGKKYIKVEGQQKITPALLELIPKSLLFYNIVWLAEPALKKGLLTLTLPSILTAIDNTHHGIMLCRGKLSYTAKTPGLDYAEETNAPTVGTWVALAKHAGQRRPILLDPDGGAQDPTNLIYLATVTDTDIQEVLTADQVTRIKGWL